MTYYLGSGSRANLEGVHPDLVLIVERGIALTKVDFSIIEGVRTTERQMKLFQMGATQLMQSRHLTGHAIDLAPWVDGMSRFDWPLFYPIADAMKMAAMELQIPLRWGGDWNGNGIQDESFRDGPHFELPRKDYPA